MIRLENITESTFACDRRRILNRDSRSVKELARRMQFTDDTKNALLLDASLGSFPRDFIDSLSLSLSAFPYFSSREFVGDVLDNLNAH